MLETMGDISTGMVDVHIVGALEPEALTALPPDERVVIVDAVVGVCPGRIVQTDLTKLSELDRYRAPTSTHRLPLSQALGIASIMRGGPIEGHFIGIGIESVEPGSDLSPRVRDRMPALGRLVLSTIDGLAIGAQPTPA